MTVPHAESLRLTNALTLSAWVRPAANNNWRTVLMKELAEGGSYGLYSSNGSVPQSWLQMAENGEEVKGESALPLNQWSHLAVTYNGSTASLYVNGTLLNQEPIAGDLVDDGGVLRLGGNSVWPSEFFSGRIDEVRVYNRAQSATEIQADMSTPIGAAPLVAVPPVVQTPSAVKAMLSSSADRSRHWWRARRAARRAWRRRSSSGQTNHREASDFSGQGGR